MSRISLKELFAIVAVIAMQIWVIGQIEILGLVLRHTGGGGFMLPMALVTEWKNAYVKAYDDGIDGLQPTASLESARKKFREEVDRLIPAEAGYREKKVKKLNEILIGEIRRVLSDKEYKRLYEICLQSLGVGILDDAAVSSKLRLTKKQQQKIQAARGKSREATREALRYLKSGDFAEYAKRVATARKQHREMCLGILTSDQVKSFRQLLGEPFSFESIR